MSDGKRDRSHAARAEGRHVGQAEDGRVVRVGLVDDKIAERRLAVCSGQQVRCAVGCIAEVVGVLQQRGAQRLVGNHVVVLVLDKQNGVRKDRASGNGIGGLRDNGDPRRIRVR